MKPLLTIVNLCVDFISGNNVSHALHNISLSVNKGEVVAIVGESGSGKSVTALSVLQLIPSPPAVYKNGAIIFNNNGKEIDLLKLTHQEIQLIRGKEIAMIFQEPMSSLNPVQTCGHQVAEMLQLHKKINSETAKAETIDLFKQVQLPAPKKMFYRYPHEISGGQKQRVIIAMAMSCNPQLLICDEPTTALDVTVQKNILLLIRNLQQQKNMSVIFISHDLGVVSEIADKIIVMYRGKIVEQGKTKALLSNPQHPYTKALLACRPALHSKNERLPVVSDFMDTDEAGTIFERINTNDQLRINNEQLIIDQPLIKVENLKVWYPAHTTFLGKVTEYNKAVNDVSFEIYKGETLGLVGESGCGKTTLGRCLLGLIPPTNGKIFFANKDISKATGSEFRVMRKEMQIIFQDPYSSLNPRKKIGDAIAEPLKVHHLFASEKQRKQKVIQLLEKVNLSADHYNRYPHEFSGGQRQRIVIARALALEPKFVVCDESVSALDVSVQAQVLNLLNDLKKEFNFTALFISHDLSVIRYISDRIVVMNKGIIEETGNAGDLYLHPQTAYTKQLIASIPGVIYEPNI
ncbi:MAG TPA: ABC transporter ATP-binding protein [Panacibacter sp.]|nr:ABC transporter ATP-binding protein [Panacibacter sp.]